jgi:hypothetical protein
MHDSPEDGALLGLSTLGPGNYLKLPDKIVGKDGTQTAARSFDKGLLDGLVKAGFAVFDQKLEGYALSPAGAKRVMRNMLLGTPMEPIHALEALVKFGAVVGIRKAEGETYSITVIMSGTAYVAANADLGAAVLAAKKKVDETLIGS